MNTITNNMQHKFAPPMEVVQAVCDFYQKELEERCKRRRDARVIAVGIRPRNLRTNLRTQEFVFCRTLLTYYLRRQCKWSVINIGFLFNRDHTSVVNMVRLFDTEYKHHQKGMYSELMQHYEQLKPFLDIQPTSKDIPAFLKACELDYGEMLEHSRQISKGVKFYSLLKRAQEDYALAMQRAEFLKGMIEMYERKGKPTATT